MKAADLYVAPSPPNRRRDAPVPLHPLLRRVKAHSRSGRARRALRLQPQTQSGMASTRNCSHRVLHLFFESKLREVWHPVPIIAASTANVVFINYPPVCLPLNRRNAHHSKVTGFTLMGGDGGGGGW